jgi:pentatricopeptide repeat domain-containing protein 1
MQRLDEVPDTATYRYVIDACASACARDAERERALHLLALTLESMRALNLPPAASTYQSVIRAFAVCGEWQAARHLLNEMRLRGLEPGEITYTIVIDACAKGGEWRAAIGALEEMRSRELEPGVITYNSVINACAKGGEWQRALDLLEEIRSRALVPDNITYGSVINACGKGGEWQRALHLLEEMQWRHDLTPDLTTYGAALNACAISRQPEHALSLFAALEREGRAPNQPCWNNLIDAIGPTHAQSRSVLLQMLREQRLLVGAVSVVAQVPTFDLHGLGEEAAAAVVRWWLLEELPRGLAAREMSRPTRVRLITGRGNSRRLPSKGGVKKRVLALVDELDGTIVRQSNQGLVVVEWPLRRRASAP